MIKKLSLIILSVTVLISFSLVSYQAKGELLSPRFNITELLYPILYLKTLISDFLSFREENLELKKELLQASLQNKSQNTLIEENKRLKALLGLKENRKDIVALANVISKGSNKILKTILIDKGSSHGIYTGYPVITPKGVVGKVLNVSSHFSEVILITDPNFSIAVRIERTRAEGVLTGKGNICVVKYVPLEEEVVKGDRIITSGLDGIFPEGLLVGAVASVDKKQGLYQKIEVVPLQQENKIEEVAVIKKS